MKATLSENFYFKYWESMMQKYGKDANLEEKLQTIMKFHTGLPEIATEAIRKIEAETVAARCKQDLLKKMAMIKRLESGESSLGYTTKSQGFQAMKELREGFEFTCLALREFKKKYNITSC